MIGINVSGSSSWHATRPNNLRVGSDLMELKRPTTGTVPNERIEFQKTQDLTSIQKALYARARSAVDGPMSFSAGLGTLHIEPGEGTGARQATLTWKDMHGEEQSLEFSLTDDTRITWDDKGAPRVLRGAQALDEKGILKAQGANDFLIRVNAAVVQGGDAQSTVLNLSEAAGTFIGGKGGMAFWGSYKDSTITGGEGENRFAGVFTNSAVTGGASKDTFSGFFAESYVKGGDGDDTFSGIFFDNTEVFGEDGDDSFTGRFVTAKLYGGAGKNFFGFQAELGVDQAVSDLNNSLTKLADREEAARHALDSQEFFMEGSEAINTEKPKDGLVMQFANVVIDAGEGDAELSGSFQDADITLGKGKNTVSGFILDSHVDGSAAERNDMHLGLAEHSTVLSGEGDDSIQMVTGRDTRIDAGDGEDEITIGDHKDRRSNVMQFDGLELDLPFTEFYPDTGGRVTHGTLEYNTVNAAKGKNQVAVNTGDEDVSFLSGDKVGKEETEEEGEEEAVATEAATSDAAPDQAAGNAPASLAEALAPVADTEGDDPTEKDEEKEEEEPGDLKWQVSREDLNKTKGTSSGAVQVIMNDDQRRSFDQSYGARKAKKRTFTNFASSNPKSWVV